MHHCPSGYPQCRYNAGTGAVPEGSADYIEGVLSRCEVENDSGYDKKGEVYNAIHHSRAGSRKIL